MKQGWEIKKIKDICYKESSNIAQNKIVELDGDYPVYGASGFIQNVDFYQRDTNYIGVVKDGSGVGRVNIYPAFSSLLGTLQYILPKNGFHINYVAYALKSLNLSKYASGAAIPHIYFKDYGEEVIPVPPLPVQERIVSELDLLNGIIEKKREQLKELDALAQSIFYDMFGDPITNEKGWEVKKLGEVCKVNPSKKDTSIGLSNSDIVSFLPMEDLPIKACYHSPKQTRLFSEVQSSYTCFANNDVLMAKVTPCFENGKIGIASNLMNGIGYGSSEFIVIRANNIDVIKEYPYFVIQNTSFIENACAQLTGTSGLRRVPRQYVENCNISIPPLPLQHQFATKIEAIEKLKELIKQSISETETLFNARMQEHFG